ncbi:hypothetical protein FCT18_04695 [Lysinibacillus sphaericus]|uniref:Uncharacterized protein n=1 Tax=Lysinibacillus sphaericus TaxID=1421 RepID=A0A2S0K0V8_LYSSH|nr:hypothetical protein [Lysinibacillus sphaericus]AVK96939.1 hypothetical protein LS41612_12030 [Lysinibacillus sphaericus]MED4542213.1 hypothetical protein [Lysinibacillus sphaericus]TKI20496.1 hypothetical protein FCT18_04695 [Lysinibacillus sphaericus]SUV17219.1 Uncharacterised protein [Lysinibacillus sphaericus]GEC81815.1 hypothetical protein LSP03_15580 [Lysinibacillus sphaericus]
MININLLQAYELDKLSKLGISDEEILQTLRTGEVSSWRTKEPNYEFQETLALYQEGEQQFLDALHGNYRIKYVTLPGIQRLLHLRFQLEETKDFQLAETGIQNLVCDEAIISKLLSMLSTNWKITQQMDGTYSIFAN